MSLRFKNIVITVVCLSGAFFCCESVKAEYYKQAVAVSTNILSGQPDVAQIDTFHATTTIPASTTVYIQFSEDNATWFASNGLKWQWDTLASGTNSIDLSMLDWQTANFYYKIKMITDYISTPTIDEVSVEYSDTYTPPPASGLYYKQAAVLSTNLLSGKLDVAQLTTFEATTTIAASTNIYVQYSQDGSAWYSSNGIKGSWDQLSSGGNVISLGNLYWTTANFYYHFKLGTDIATITPEISEVKINYSDTYTPPVGPGGYYRQAVAVSGDMLSGLNAVGAAYFGYKIDSLPGSATMSAQYSTSSTAWYNSSCVKGGWDTLAVGDHTSQDDAIDLSALNLSSPVFYYKIKFTSSDGLSTAELDEVEIYYYTLPEVDSASTTIIASRTATANAVIKSTGGFPISVCGFKYGLSPADTWTISQTGTYETFPYHLLMTNLSPNTTYYVRPFVTNEKGTGYGEYDVFTTSENPIIQPTILNKGSVINKGTILR